MDLIFPLKQPISKQINLANVTHTHTGGSCPCLPRTCRESVTNTLPHENTDHSRCVPGAAVMQLDMFHGAEVNNNIKNTCRLDCRHQYFFVLYCPLYQLIWGRGTSHVLLAHAEYKIEMDETETTRNLQWVGDPRPNIISYYRAACSDYYRL